MNEQLPFLLKQGEKIILDAGSVQYYGIGITNIGFFGGGTLGRGFGGIATGTQVKREKSFLDAVNCHVYPTNSRIVFIKAKLSLLSMNKETKLENIFSEIPLEAIEGIYSGSKSGSVPEVVEKGIGISYPIGKPTNRKGGYTDEERIPQETVLDHVRTGVIVGRACRPTAGVIRPGGGQAAVNRSPGRRGYRLAQAPAL